MQTLPYSSYGRARVAESFLYFQLQIKLTRPNRLWELMMKSSKSPFALLLFLSSTLRVVWYSSWGKEMLVPGVSIHEKPLSLCICTKLLKSRCLIGLCDGDFPRASTTISYIFETANVVYVKWWSRWRFGTNYGKGVCHRTVGNTNKPQLFIGIINDKRSVSQNSRTREVFFKSVSPLACKILF